MDSLGQDRGDRLGPRGAGLPAGENHLDTFDRLGKGLVLPDDHDLPSGFNQTRNRFSVPLAIARDLVLPEPSVALGCRVMTRASVPVAAMYEHRDLLAREDKVGATIEVEDRFRIDSVSVSECVECSAESEFRLGVASPVPQHGASSGR